MNPDESPSAAPGIAPEDMEMACRKAFMKGVNTALTLVVEIGAVWTIFVTLSVPPRFENVFKDVGVDLSSLVLAVLKYHVHASFLLAAMVVACVFAMRKIGHRRLGIAANLVCLGLLGVWMTVLTVSLYRPLIDLLHGLGSH